jgi:lipase ATG15
MEQVQSCTNSLPLIQPMHLLSVFAEPVTVSSDMILIYLPLALVYFTYVLKCVAAWDALADAQLWSSAALAQYVRALLPVGEIWTPILMTLVKGVSLIETKSLEEVSYYRQTTEFVKKVVSEGYLPSITGHSLGGGLAIVTGAQTKRPVVALSGPNSMISRSTFDPPLDVDDLNQYTFNIIPDRDPVPRSK